MSKGEMVDRFLAAQARIDSYRLRTGTLDDNQWRRLAAVAGRVSETPIYIGLPEREARLTLRGAFAGGTREPRVAPHRVMEDCGRPWRSFLVRQGRQVPDGLRAEP